MTKGILVYPKSSNPYQDLLYDGFSSKFFTVRYLLNPTTSHLFGLFLLPFQIIMHRLLGFKLFHLHFFYPFQLFAKHRVFHSLFFKTLYSIYFYSIISLIRILKYKLVWTAHDLIPRSNQFSNKLNISRFIAKVSDVVIVHSKSTIDEMAHYHIRTKRIEIIPIGNYADIYKNSITKEKARTYLNIPTKGYVYGHFGRIEYYKGIVELIEAFERINLPDSYLLIAGECMNDSLKTFIDSKAKLNKNIRPFLSYVSDEHIQYYLNCSDIMVYPFREITTSSSLILSMSFRKCIICPRIGDATDIPSELGLFYKSGVDSNILLMEKMAYSYNNRKKINDMNDIAYTYIQQYNWSRIAKNTSDLYEQIIAS